MTAPETISHIRLDERGRAWIDDTKVKVIEVVLDHLAYGWSADEIHEQHPHLSLAQVHAALTYYYDHQAELEAQIQREAELVRRLRESTGDSPMQRRLRAAALAR
ncbi:MAG: DUF433 domain-containing protein [Verrucomicrobia bacterium]|nr:DUF433 domain-containing protein [Verrucomicrobiota bacterium]